MSLDIMTAMELAARDLARVLKGCLSPTTPQLKPQSLNNLCLRTAAIYVTTSLYDFHNKQTNNVVEAEEIQENMWDEVFPLLDQHFFQLIPVHMYECFLDNVLCALEVAGHYDHNGKQLMQYIILFFPKQIKRFRAQRYADRVLMPTICCLHKCTNLEELYLEKADSSAITTYLLAHTIKHLNNIRVLSLPKQTDDDVASIIGINCPRLESIILTGTNVTNTGLSWLLCCRNLHTIIIPGFFQGITPKGVALLLNGNPCLRHVVYDVMSDVLTYIDFNTSEAVLPIFGLKTVLFHSMELLSSNHLELVTKLCPNVEWLSLDSALFYNLEGLGYLPNLTLLRLNYKSRAVDQTVVDFFSISCANLTTLHLFDVKDIHMDDLRLTIGQCKCVETVVMSECSVREDWIDHFSTFDRKKPLSESVRYMQLIDLQILPHQLVEFLRLFKDILVLEMDVCDLDLGKMKSVLLEQPLLQILRCPVWRHMTPINLANLQQAFRHCSLQLSKESLVFEEDYCVTMAANLLADYVDFAPTVPLCHAS